MRFRVEANVITLASLIIAVLLAAGWVANYYLAVHAIHVSDHRWCATLELLTSRPVPKPADPQANQSLENAYVFYLHLKDLEKNFGCLAN